MSIFVTLLMIVLEVVGERFVERRRRRMRGRRHEQRVAVGRRLRRLARAEYAAGAADILDDHRLTEPLAQWLRDQPRNDVGRAAGHERNDQRDRTRRPTLSGGGARQEQGGETEDNRQGVRATQSILPVFCGGSYAVMTELVPLCLLRHWEAACSPAPRLPA